MTYEERKSPAAEGATTGLGYSENATRNGPTNITPEEQNVNPRLPLLVAWKDYVARIGATVSEKNPLRATVGGDESGYRAPVAEVMLSQVGKVRAPEGLEPSTDEAAAITAECKAFPWPKVRALSRLFQIGRFPAPYQHVEEDDPALFLFRDTEGQIVFAQYRIEIERDGRPDKRYLPFTPFDHGWENREPPGDYLPLFGAEQLASRNRIMIHEGAKAAKRMQTMTAEERSCHPWGQELASFGHVGWIGGAACWHRTDWAQIAKAGIKEVVIVADNDEPGVEVIPRISKALGIRVMVIRFSQQFPPAFDLGDAFPDELWKTVNDKRRYQGPSFLDCLEPATWATRKLPAKGKGAPEFVLRKEFARDWFNVKDLGQYVSASNTNRRYNADKFNRAVRPFSDVEQTHRKMDQVYAQQVDGLDYRPDLPAGVIHSDNGVMLNTYRPTDVKPIVGDPGPFIKFMEHVFPRKDERPHALRWCATMIAKPEIRPSFSMLMVSEAQGVGKSTLADIMTVLVGPHNTSTPAAETIVNDNSTAWAAEKKLVVIPEIYSGGARATADRLKTIITDETIHVRKLFNDGYSARNFVSILASSNSFACLGIVGEDRRWLIPEITETLLPHAYWKEFRAWLHDEGFGIILHWAQTYGDYLERGEHAPFTRRKKQMIEEGMGEGQRIAHTLGVALFEAGRRGKKLLVTDHDLDRWVRSMLPDGEKMPRKATLRKAMKMDGIYITRNEHRPWVPKVGLCYLLSNFDLGDQDDWGVLKHHSVDPRDLIDGAPLGGDAL